MTVQTETSNDIEHIRSITTAAFKDEKHSSQTEAAIVDALRKSGALTLSLVLHEGSEVIGHVAFSPVVIDGRDCGWFGLGPVSVRPDKQGVGVGSLLIRDGLERLGSMGANGCVVLGNPAYYSRFGFKNDAALRFEEAPPEYFMRLAFNGSTPLGRVTFHEGFNAR